MRINATPVVLLIGALWVVVTLLGMSGLWFAGLLLSLVTTGATGDELDERAEVVIDPDLKASINPHLL
jgi:hypothetical protein